MSDVNKYMLTPKEQQQWYETVIKPMFTDGCKASDKPTFLLITGQPGAGKTTAWIKTAEQMIPYPVRFSGDDIRKLHPYHHEIIREHHEEYPFITKPDMSWARQKLIDDSLKNHLNIQMDCILSNPNDWRMGTLLQAKDAGYRIECLVLGVHRYISEVSMFGRREEQIELEGVGFPPTMDVHDIAYNLLSDVTSKMYKEKIADRVTVCDRNFNIYYDTDTVKQASVQCIKQGIYKSRQSYINNNEALEYIKSSWENVIKKMTDRNADKEDILQAKKYYNEFCQSSGINNKQNSNTNNLIYMLQQRNQKNK